MVEECGKKPVSPLAKPCRGGQRSEPQSHGGQRSRGKKKTSSFAKAMEDRAEWWKDPIVEIVKTVQVVQREGRWGNFPASLDRRYSCLLLRGLSGKVISTNPASMMGLKTWSRNLVPAWSRLSPGLLVFWTPRRSEAVSSHPSHLSWPRVVHLTGLPPNARLCPDQHDESSPWPASS